MYYLSESNDSCSNFTNSKFERLARSSPQNKGKKGSEIVKQFYGSRGIAVTLINDRGDSITHKETGDERNEEKTSKLSLQNQFHWNQIRPNEPDWDVVHLIGISPDNIYLWRFTRQEILSIVKDGHKGTNDLKEVKIKLKDIDQFNPYLMETISAKDVLIG